MKSCVPKMPSGQIKKKPSRTIKFVAKTSKTATILKMGLQKTSSSAILFQLDGTGNNPARHFNKIWQNPNPT